MAKILIVEDESAAWSTREALESFGYTVVGIVATANAAIQTATVMLPDLALIEVRLKGSVDGIAIAKQIRLDLDIPIVYLTDVVDDETLQRALATDPFGYLIKPVHTFELHTTIEVALRCFQSQKRSNLEKAASSTSIDGIDGTNSETILGETIQPSEYYLVTQLHASLEQQNYQRAVQLHPVLAFEALLKRITDKVRDSLDEHQILQTVVQELASGLEIDGCDAGIYNADRTTSTICYEFTTTLPPYQGATFELAEATDPAVYHQLLQGRYCQFCFSTFSPIRIHERQVAILAVPLFDGQNVVGDLWLFKPAHMSFNDLEERLVQQVSSQCAIGLRQARLYESAQAQVKELARLNQLKDDFLNTVSHELRTPLANIRLATQMLEIVLERSETLHDAAEQSQRYLQILRDECHQETSLINDLLNLTRLDAGDEPLLLTSINLQAWIPHLTEPFLERIHSQQQHLQIDLPEQLPFLETDLSTLGRIFSELLDNACKYTPVGEIIQISATTIADRLEILVSNSGIEIPDTELPRVFDKFYRIPNNDPWKHRGTGLGLALAKKLTEYLGGSIEAVSATGRTIFKVMLPLKTKNDLLLGRR